MEKPKSNQPKAAAAAIKPAIPAVPTKVAPMFRPNDWLTMAVTFGVIWIIYLFTLAPEQTLEDSGELCTGAFYAGIPHPPGYPFWSVYAWFWTAILPWGNVAWRVEVGESFAAAMGCGLLALMVSRGTICENSGPKRKSFRPVLGSRMKSPTTCSGCKSGVHWMRLKVQPTLCATARESMVLATPGTSSNKMCPSANKPTTASVT
jgi:hypothetical protein